MGRLGAFELRGKLGHLALLATVSVVAAFLVSPGLYGQQIPALGAEDVGRPFSSASPSGLKAGRDYEIVDEAMTRRRREEARESVLPVFDYDRTVHSGTSRAVRSAFGLMQELGERGSDAAPGDAEKQPRPQTTEDAILSAPNKQKKGKERETDQQEEALNHRLREERKRFDGELFGVEDEDFETLVQARFSRDIEQALLTLLEAAYRPKIVASRDDLARVGTQGITIRIVGGSSEHRSAAGSPQVVDVSEAKAELDRFASVPGNLLPEAPERQRLVVLRLAKKQIRPDLTVNIAETEARRRAAVEAVKPAIISIKKGQKVIGDGELITESHLVTLRGMRAQTDRLDAFELQVGGAGLVALLVAGFFVFCRSAFRQFRPTRRDALFLGLLLLGMLGLMHLWVTIADAVHERYPGIPIEALYYCIPVAAGAMLVRFMLAQELALFFALVLACMAGVLAGNSLSYGIYALLSSLVAAERVGRAKDRAGIFRAGVATGAVNLVLVLAFSLAEGKGLSTDTLVTGVFAFVGTALFAPAVVMAMTPLVESTFGYASDIKLLELANLNHPALKELIVQAPGTYHHSIIIGSLVEAAAEGIGANPLLARSCAYYHDIGKGRNPLYFGENQKGENRHDTLAPAMSAVIIKRHVTDGLEMARQYKLPQRVTDCIPQHHGTRLVGYFFHRALKEQDGKEAAPPIDESIYRYAGPKPQFREAALVMIADAVEAASRAMPEPTAPKLQALVQKLINTIFSEGQLDECDLTLRDLNVIAHSFVRTLESIYHARPAYPPGALGGSRPGEAARTALSVAKPEKTPEGKRVG